ncbi:MAG: ABC transporter permease [Vicinamibacterales bacterium]
MSIRSWLKRRRLDEDDFQDEIRAHLAMAEHERMADGADRETAHYASLKEFGNVTLTTESARRVWTPWWVESVRGLLSDVRYAIRTLAKNPAFSLTVVGVLTLGIGLNAAVFTMLKGIALSPVAGVDGSARLAVIYGETSGGRELALSYPDYQYLRDHNQAFSGLFGSSLGKANLGRGRGARQIWAELVTGNYFQVLGVRAERGRTLLPTDELAPGAHPVVVLGHGLWERDFASDPDIVGKTIDINDRTLTVVGVADAAFHGTTVVYDVEAYLPVMMASELGFNFGSQPGTPGGVFADRRATMFQPQGYLKPGVTLATAAAQIDALWAELARERPLAEVAQRLKVVPFWQAPSGAPLVLLPTLGVVSAMGLLVLLIACANIAGLVLVRGLSRRGEIAVRLALGAARARVVRLLVVENLVIAVPGAILGVLLAQRGIRVLAEYAERLAAPERVFFNIEVDGLVIGFAVAIACLCAMVFGLVPAFQSSRMDLALAINEDASPRGAARGRMRAGLVVAQVAVSVLLLVGAGLVTRSLEAARQANPGFDSRQVAIAAVDVKQNRYDEPRGRVFYRDLVAAARADATTESATLAAFTPLGFLDTPTRRVAIEGYEPRRGEDLSFMSNTIGSDYFRTLRIPLIAGREFDDRDDEAGTPVVIVNHTLAQRFWDDAANAVGKRVQVGDAAWRTVIGVAADVKYSRIDEPPRPYLYLPFLQSYRSNMILHTRGSAPVNVLMDQARAHLATLDADLPILYVRQLADGIKGALILLNLAATMLFAFGVTGMALAAIGTYGLVSYTVRQSTREIGIRMALGASRLVVVRGFVVSGLRLGGVGIVLGTAAALGANTLLGSVLFGVTATDGPSFVRALAIVLGGVIVATVVPAWRAARTSPLMALRHH